MKQDLVVSMVRFSAALTAFSIQQTQKVMGALTNSAERDESIDKFCATLDRVTAAFTAEVGEKHKPTLDSLTQLGDEAVDASRKGLDAIAPAEIVDSAAKVMRKAADAMTDALKSATDAEKPEPTPSDQ